MTMWTMLSACMAQYEMRLSRRGFRTPFESLVEEFLAIPPRVGCQLSICRICSASGI